jgi:ketosteroid isomerase-like protein
MRTALSCVTLCLAFIAGCAAPPAALAPVDRAALERQVGDVERAFARTMVERDLAAFGSFLSEETVFFSGPTPLRGKKAVTDYWKRFYERPAPPFSWRPDLVEALESGTLALTTGPVFDPDGKCIGRFTSIWRQEAAGVWRIVFDKGGPCDL